jgi:hypothetical protein
MRTEEWKQGRVFHLEFEEDENFYAEITRFVKEKKSGPDRFWCSVRLRHPI